MCKLDNKGAVLEHCKQVDKWEAERVEHLRKGNLAAARNIEALVKQHYNEEVAKQSPMKPR